MNSKHPSPSREDGHLLVVDDNPVNRKLAMAFAARLGWKATELDGGEKVLPLLAITSFDIILLDISMPGVSGEEVLEQLRATPALQHQKVVAYTAHALPDEQKRLLAAGFDGLLIKPINFQSLADVLAGALRS